MGINAKPIERATPIGSAAVASPSPSVYQTMYRSIFDWATRGAARAGTLAGSIGSGGPLSSESGAASGGGASQRPKKAGNVFYVVLRLVVIFLSPSVRGYSCSANGARPGVSRQRPEKAARECRLLA